MSGAELGHPLATPESASSKMIFRVELVSFSIVKGIGSYVHPWAGVAQLESKHIYILLLRCFLSLPVAESIGHEWFIEGPIVAQEGIILCISIFLTWIKDGKTSIRILAYKLISCLTLCLRDKRKIPASADGGPRSRVCAD